MRLVIASDINMRPLLHLWQVSPERSRYNPSWTVNLIDGLKDIPDLELHVVTLSDLIPRDLEVELEGIHYHFIKIKGRLKLATLYWAEKTKIARKIREIKPDLVHVHFDKVYALGAVKSGYPFVTTVHALQEVIEQFEGATITLKLEKFFQQWLWKRTRFMICVSPYVADHVGKKTQAVCRVIPNVIADLFFEQTADGNGGPEELLFVGGISRRKNLDSILKAMGQLKGRHPHLRLQVAGVVPTYAGPYGAEIERIIEGDGLKDRVKFLGYREPAAVAELMGRCTVLVHPARQETFGMTVAEAMALGLPVVTSNNSGMSFLVQDGRTGLLVDDPGDPAAIAAAIDRLLGDAGLRRSLAVKAREDAMARFSKESVAQQHYQFYREIMGNL